MSSCWMPAFSRRRTALAASLKLSKKAVIVLLVMEMLSSWGEAPLVLGLLGGNVAPEVEHDVHTAAVTHGLTAPDPLLVLPELGDVPETLRFDAGAGLPFREAVGARLHSAGAFRASRWFDVDGRIGPATTR